MAFSRKQNSVLKRLVLNPRVSDVCRGLGIERGLYYRWRNTSPEFRTASDEAIDYGLDRAEELIIDSALTDPDKALQVLALRRPERWSKNIQSERISVPVFNIIEEKH